MASNVFSLSRDVTLLRSQCTAAWLLTAFMAPERTWYCAQPTAAKLWKEKATVRDNYENLGIAAETNNDAAVATTVHTNKATIEVPLCIVNDCMLRSTKFECNSMRNQSCFSVFASATVLR